MYTSPDANGIDTSKEFSQTQALIEITNLIAREVAAARIDELEKQAAVTSGVLDPEKCMKLLAKRHIDRIASLKKGEQL